MKLQKHHTIMLIAIIVIAVLFILNKEDNKPPETKEPITIGYMAALTGDAAIYGVPMQQAMQMIEKETNANGGIQGRHIKVIYEDSKCDAKSAVNAAQKLISVDHVKVIIGGICSSEVLAIAPFVEQQNVVLISPGASSPEITHAGEYIFRIAPSDTYSGKKLAETMNEKGIKSVAILSEKTSYALGIRGTFLENAKQLGLNISYDEQYGPDMVDFRSEVSKIKKSGLQAVFINSQTGAGASRIAKALYEQSVDIQKYVFFMSDDSFVKSGQGVNDTYILDIGAVANQKLGNIFMNNFESNYQTKPSFAPSATYTYDAGKILINALQSVGENPEKIRDYLYSMGPYTGIAGNISFDSNGDSEGMDVFFLEQVQNNELVKI